MATNFSKVSNGNQDKKKQRIYYPKCLVAIDVIYEDQNAVRPPDVISVGDKQKELNPFGATLQVIPLSLEPIECRIYLDAFTRSSTFTLTVDAKDVPYALEAAYIGGVKIYLFQTNTLITDTADIKLPDPTLIGTFDEIEYEYDPVSGGGVYKISGGDLTNILIQRKYALTNKIIYTDEDITNTIQKLVDLATSWTQIVDNHEVPGPAQTNGTSGTSIATRMKVKWLNNDETLIELDQVTGKDKDKIDSIKKSDELPSVVQVQGKHLTKNGKPPKTSAGTQDIGKAGGANKNRHDTYWDVITSLCREAGLQVFIRGYTVAITTTENLLSIMNNTPAYVMVVGENIKKYSNKKTFRKNSIPQIKVYWYSKNSTNTNTIEVAKYPPSTSVVNNVPIQQLVNGIVVEVNKTIEVPAPMSVNSQEKALEIAKWYYHNMARNQVAVHIVTNDLRTHVTEEASNITKYRDLLEIRPGYPLYIQLDDLWNEQFQGKTEGQIVQLLQERDMNSKIAKVIANNYNTINHWQKTAYYVKNVKFQFSIKNGVEIDIELNNFSNPSYDEMEKT